MDENENEKKARILVNGYTFKIVMFDFRCLIPFADAEAVRFERMAFLPDRLRSALMVSMN